MYFSKEDFTNDDISLSDVIGEQYPIAIEKVFHGAFEEFTKCFSLRIDF